ncbi:LysE family translocator [Paenibacillus pinisoli]|uniref:LysE family translocator n=1 Tax=Paenibacillus pinisoli TaxID=1276110 RepID=A0A3A6PD60_9BACL|nr:LysE family transporter [Paenibacillus pinisoli]RJX37970.1 LysE family translocator [Paenibacillus pinisoli]
MSLTSFLIYCIIATITPGPTNIVILSTVHRFGSKKAMEYTYGATLGLGLLLMISATLNTWLIAYLPKIMVVMQIIGTLYMLYLAYLIYRMDVSKAVSNQAASFWSGIMMQFLNPKVVLYSLTVIPAFILPHYSSSSARICGIAVVTLIGFLAFLTWVLFGAMFKTFLLKHKRIVNICMALSLAYAAIMIWL